MKRLLYTMAALTFLGSGVEAQEFDDIYYNPQTDNTQTSSKKNTKKSNIIDFSSMDPDEYNRRGQYYTSPIDTIGARAENDEDFVYTQQIQRFYNPTIVVDNMNMLESVLANSYGNVNIVFDNGTPYFSSIYGWPGFYNYYYAGWNPIWSPGWAPAWTWNWGPSWTWFWGPCFGYGTWGWDSPWGWGPAWDYGWGWRPAWSHAGYWNYAQYSPYGRYPNRPGSQWASNTRPGGNYYGGTSHYPSNSGYNRPGTAGPVGNTTGGKNYYNYHRTSGSNATASQNRVTGTANDNRLNTGSSSGTSRYSGRTSNNGAGGSVYTNTGRSNNNNSYNSNRSSGNSQSSYSNRSNSSSSSHSSYSSGSHSTGRSAGTGRSGGSSGGGRGRHR